MGNSSSNDGDGGVPHLPGCVEVADGLWDCTAEPECVGEFEGLCYERGDLKLVVAPTGTRDAIVVEVAVGGQHEMVALVPTVRQALMLQQTLALLMKTRDWDVEEFD